MLRSILTILIVVTVAQMRMLALPTLPQCIVRTKAACWKFALTQTAVSTVCASSLMAVSAKNGLSSAMSASRETTQMESHYRNSNIVTVGMSS